MDTETETDTTDTDTALRASLRHRRLNPEIQIELCINAKNGDTAARDELIANSQRLVASIAARYRHVGDLEPADLQQWGNIGLLKAIESFDPERGTRFTTYATHWIRSYIGHNARTDGHTVRQPYGLHGKRSRIKSARAELYQVLNREATVEELAAHTGYPVKEITETIDITCVSIEGGTEEDPIIENLSDPTEESLEEMATETIDKELLMQAITHLPQKQQRIVYLWLDGVSTEDIAMELHISQARVRKIWEGIRTSLRYEFSTSRLF